MKGFPEEPVRTLPAHEYDLVKGSAGGRSGRNYLKMTFKGFWIFFLRSDKDPNSSCQKGTA